MNKIRLFLISSILIFNINSVFANEGFVFPESSGGMPAGDGSFTQYTPHNDLIDVPGIIPVGIKDLSVILDSSVDVDIQLYDVDANKPLVGWRIGALIGDGADYAKTTYNGITIEYSGYNGDGTGKGNEYITITGVTKNRLVMKFYGYQAGKAEVYYEWKATSIVIPPGNDSFTQYTPYDELIDVPGIIPVGIKDLSVILDSSVDVDIQLYDIDANKPLVGWRIGALIGDGASYAKTTYNGITIEYSGYNGDGTNLGNEYIIITGVTKNRLVMKFYGYKAGNAQVYYSWKGNSDIIVEPPVELFQSPINANDVKYNCYNYDKYVSANGGYHVGKDYCTELDDPVYASNYGKVVAVESGNNHGFGKTVIIEHKLKNEIKKGKLGMSDTIYSFYAHLNSYNVSVGDTVIKGEKIAKVGSSGSGSGGTVHLHYEVKYSNMNGIPNPDGLNIGSSFGYDINHPDKVGFINPNTIVDDSKYGVIP